MKTYFPRILAEVLGVARGRLARRRRDLQKVGKVTGEYDFGTLAVTLGHTRPLLSLLSVDSGEVAQAVRRQPPKP